MPCRALPRCVLCRWNESFDFLDIRADSILLATVWDQATIIDAAMSLKISRVRRQDGQHTRVDSMMLIM